MPPQINNITTGDGIHVAWIDPDASCRRAYFEVTAVSETADWLTVDIESGDLEYRLVQTPPGPHMLLDQPTGPAHDELTARVVVGVAPTAPRLVWEILTTFLELGYSPADAMDVVALGYNTEPSPVYHKLRDEPQGSLQERVEEIVAQLADASENA